MSTLTAKEKVKVLLAQALFGSPDIILLDEPTNHPDIGAIEWLEDFLMEYEGLVIVVSHDRHFLNTVCTSIVDVDYGKIKMYVGNYEFWYESSQMVQKMMKDQNKRNEDKIKELQSFIQRFLCKQVKVKAGYSKKKAPRQADCRRDACFIKTLSVRRLHYGQRSRQGTPDC